MVKMTGFMYHILSLYSLPGFCIVLVDVGFVDTEFIHRCVIYMQLA